MATHGAVTTVEFADSHGMPGGATAVTQNLGVATVQAGMASSQVNVAAGASGHNPSAANPGSSAEGIETPSSMVHRASAVMQTGAQAFASSWLGRVQSLFGDATSAQPTPQAWAPSPLTSPPRQSLPLQPLERGGHIVRCRSGAFVQWCQCAAARCHGAEGPFALRISRQTSEHRVLVYSA